MHHAVDLGRIGKTAATAAFFAQRRRVVDQDLHLAADARLQLGGRDLFGHGHKSCAALFAHFLRNLAVDFVGRRAIHGRIGKATRAVDLRFAHKLQQVVKLFFRLARKAGNKGGANHQLGANLAPFGDAL